MRLIVPKRDQPKEQIARAIPKRNKRAVSIDRERTAKRSARAASDAVARRKQNNSLFTEAVDRLAQMKPSQAIEYIGTQPSSQVEVHLLAEESAQARKQVLDAFPKPGPRARARFWPESLNTPEAPATPAGPGTADEVES